MFFILAIGLVTLVTYWIRRVYTYWERKGFPYSHPQIPFGCLDSVRKGDNSFGMAIYNVYKETKEKVIGIYLMFRPALLIRDATLAREILCQDFASFHDRGIYVDEENDPFSGTLFALQGHKWRTLRAKLSPSFTSGKLKGMSATFEDVGNRMIDYLNGVIPEEGEGVVELKNLFSTYAIDIIGSVVFGMDIDSFEDPKNKFREISRKFNDPSLMAKIRIGVQILCPTLEKLFVFLGMKQEQVVYMNEIVRATVEYREKNNVSRKDLMQMLIQLRNTGKINVDDNIWDIETAAKNLKSMSIESIAGQAYLFYIAGYETSASTMAFTVYELARNPNLLAKVQKDIDDTLKKHGGKITYEAIQDMKYLNLCFLETIRKYPALPILNRECTKDYLIPGTAKTIEKGTPIIISLLGIHRDAEYFPDPLKYDPERFLEESNLNYDPTAFMPFGEGPRQCIAQRMGKINVKVAIVRLLTNFNLIAAELPEIEFDTHSITISPKDGINVYLSKKNT